MLVVIVFLLGFLYHSSLHGTSEPASFWTGRLFASAHASCKEMMFGFLYECSLHDLAFNKSGGTFLSKKMFIA
jgi:hypothetical protein